MNHTLKRIVASFFLILVITIQVNAVCNNDFSASENSFNENDFKPLKAIPFEKITFSDNFWAPRIEKTRSKSLSTIVQGMQEDGSYYNFSILAGLYDSEYRNNENHSGDVKAFKLLNAIAYSLRVERDPILETFADAFIEQIIAAQDEDGYLCTRIQLVLKDKKLNPPNSYYQMYILGHYLEAGIEYYKSTGKRKLLDGSLKYLDLVKSKIKNDPGDIARFMPGHQSIEIALAKLYYLTGKKEDLETFRFFMDNRGKDHSNPFLQKNKPLVEMEEASGHAVRGGYTYTAMAHLAAITGEMQYAEASRRLWHDLVERKMFVTGGIGGSQRIEGISEAYQLGSEMAYNETCSSIAMLFFTSQMALLYGDGKYMDVAERILYNTILAGVSLEGDRFFYCNPLEHDGIKKFSRPRLEGGERSCQRQTWYEVPCCPPNLARLLLSIGDYMYAVREDSIYVNLFANSTGRIPLSGKDITLRQETAYPWEGSIKLEVSLPATNEFSLCIRIPGWARNQPVPGNLYEYLYESHEKPFLYINDTKIECRVIDGYAVLRRVWQDGDTVRLVLPMPVRYKVANPKINNLSNKVCLQRGPLVYAAEEIDNGNVFGLSLKKSQRFIAEHDKDFLGGVTVIKGKATKKSDNTEQEFIAIPYYAWCNRGNGKMAVWLDCNDL